MLKLRRIFIKQFNSIVRYVARYVSKPYLHDLRAQKIVRLEV